MAVYTLSEIPPSSPHPPPSPHTGLPAQQTDIRVGDTIVEVEGTDVTMADGHFVVSLIR